MSMQKLNDVDVKKFPLALALTHVFCFMSQQPNGCKQPGTQIPT